MMRKVKFNMCVFFVKYLVLPPLRLAVCFLVRLVSESRMKSYNKERDE